MLKHVKEKQERLNMRSLEQRREKSGSDSVAPSWHIKPDVWREETLSKTYFRKLGRAALIASRSRASGWVVKKA
jgi:hypothetical protein